MAVNINVPSQVKTYANLAAFPASGALKTIYIAEDTNKTYRWTGSVYVEVSASASGITIGTTAITSGTVGRVLFEGTGNVVQESGNLFWDNTNGRLGVGTSSPLVSLDVRTSANSPITPLATAPNTATTFLVGNTGTNGVLALGQNNAGQSWLQGRSRLGDGSSQPILINPLGGNVLINTTTDAGFRLDVNGTARVSSGLSSTGTNYLGLNFLASNVSINSAGDPNIHKLSGNLIINAGASPQSILMYSNNTERMRIDASGNVGIGTSTPAYVLDVVGGFRIGSSTIKLGMGESGGNSVFVGSLTNQPLKFLVNTNEYARIATTGNVLINTTTDAGFRLDVNGTARINTLTIGLGAGQVASNTVVGLNALNANTTGGANTAIGNTAMFINTTGYNNTALGFASLYSNTTGFSNTAIGLQALYANQTASSNTAIGLQSLNGLTSGNGNLSLATSSAQKISGGATLTSATNSIFIGRDTRANANAETNQIVIGDTAIGAGSNTVTLGNTSIVKTILRGTLNASNLPTSSAGLSTGDIWNNLGILTIV